MPFPLVDSHAHLHTAAPEALEPMICRAQAAGVYKIVNLACSLDEIPACLAISRAHEGVFSAVGMQPTDLAEDLEDGLERLRQAAGEKKVVAIGEIGLDYYHDRFDHDKQAVFLTGQLELARQRGLPAVLHCRGGKNPGENERAFADLIAILEKTRFTNAVVHCFSGNALEAEKLLDMGLMLSFTGIITYPKNEDLRQIVKKTPLDRLMIETDSPFLPPAAHRGKPCEPAYVAEVAKTVAAVKGVDLEQVARMTTANAERFFGI